MVGKESNPIDYPQNTTMAELDVWGDKCIIFQVVKAQASLPPSLRRPPQPTNPNVLQLKSPNSKLNAQPSTIDGKANIIYEKPKAGLDLGKDNALSNMKLAPKTDKYLQGPRASPWSADYASHQAMERPNQQVYNPLSMPQQEAFTMPRNSVSVPKGLGFGILSPSKPAQPVFTTQGSPSIRTPGFELYVATFSASARSRLPFASSCTLKPPHTLLHYN